MTVQPRRKVAVIGAPLDLGQDRRGVDMGPSAIRYAGLETELERIGVDCTDWGNIPAPVAEATTMGDENARFLEQIKHACDNVAKLVAQAHGQGGVLWVDAHGDLNTPATSPTGNVHGMVLAAAMGIADGEFAYDQWPLPAVDPARVALVGVRSLDVGERELLHRLAAKVFTMSEIDRIGIERAMRESIEHVAGGSFVHVSLDMDVVDPAHAPGVGTPVRGGLSYREAHLAMELVAESGLAGSLEVVEVNPILDRENETARLAVELVASALGARIL